MAKSTPKPGDRVAYAARFLRDTCQQTGAAPARRGTFVKLWEANTDFARVKWDDFEIRAEELAYQYGEDYVADAREHGQLVLAKNIAVVGSAKFALTCA
jgi:hypothetical protein